DRLRPVDSPGAREAAFMKDASGGFPFKVTFPAASIFTHPLTTVVGPDGSGYGSLEEFVSDAVEIERGLVADAIRAGATSIQFDFPLYTYLVDPAWEIELDRGTDTAGNRTGSRWASSVSMAGDFVDTMPITIKAPALRNRIGSNPPSRRRSSHSTRKASYGSAPKTRAATGAL